MSAKRIWTLMDGIQWKCANSDEFRLYIEYTQRTTNTRTTERQGNYIWNFTRCQLNVSSFIRHLACYVGVCAQNSNSDRQLFFPSKPNRPLSSTAWKEIVQFEHNRMAMSVADSRGIFGCANPTKNEHEQTSVSRFACRPGHHRCLINIFGLKTIKKKKILSFFRWPRFMQCVSTSNAK